MSAPAPEGPIRLNVLLIEDDAEYLRQFEESLPDAVDGYRLELDSCKTFDDGLARLRVRRYDLVLTDVYAGRARDEPDLETKDRAKDVVAAIRNVRFTPVLMFSSATRPEIPLGHFIRFVDKSRAGLVETEIKELIASGIPLLARRLHDDIDANASTYLWGFLEKNWEKLGAATRPAALSRIVRRRASVQLARFGSEDVEKDVVENGEFYLYPPISAAFRLGEVIRGKKDRKFRVILTPRCLLAHQMGSDKPRVERALVAKTHNAQDMFAARPIDAKKDDATDKSRERYAEKFRKRLQSPASELGGIEGRYWFVPNFLEIPDLYCDLLDIETVAITTLKDEFERIAVLDAPFAEALQASFVRLYSAVGLPGLDSASFPLLHAAAARAQKPAQATPSEGGVLAAANRALQDNTAKLLTAAMKAAVDAQPAEPAPPAQAPEAPPPAAQAPRAAPGAKTE